MVLVFSGSGRHQHQRRGGGHAGFVIRAVFPEAQQQHRQLAGHGHDGAFLFADAGAGEVLAVGAQGTGRTERAEDVMRGADQQFSQQAVAAFADAQLFVRAPALVAARTKTEIRPDVAAAAKARRLADLQHEAHGRERPHAGDLLEALGDGIIHFATRDQAAFQGFDLFGDQGQHRQHRLDHRQTIGGHNGQDVFMKRLRRRIADRVAEALEREPHGVDEVHAGAHQAVAQFEAEEIVLGLGGAVLQGMEQGRVGAGEAGEHHGIAAVALAFMAGDGVELAGISHDDGRAKTREVTTDPRTVRARFQRHGGGGIVVEQQRQGHAVIEHGPFVNDLARGIKHTDVMAAIAEIEAEGKAAGRGRDGGSGNDGRSSFSLFFHRQSRVTQ